MKKIIGTVITLIIGGTVYTFSQTDVVKNFSKNTGLTQQEAEQYISEIKDEDLVSFAEIGSDFIFEGQDMVEMVNDIDCINYEYEWESYTLSCGEGKSQLKSFGNSEIALGRSYKALESEKAGKDEISSVIRNIDRLNSDLSLNVVTWMLDPSTIDEIRRTNSYNKALLQAALDSD